MNDPVCMCPRCETFYFEPIAECDWCPDVATVPLDDVAASLLEKLHAAEEPQ